jgi:hypothetical protein
MGGSEQVFAGCGLMVTTGAATVQPLP